MDWSQSLRLTAPELLLTIYGLVLLLASAWARGRRDARWVTWIAVATLFVAAVMVAPALFGGAHGAGAMAFGGLYAATAFAAFAKLLIYAAAGAVLLVSRPWAWD